MVAEHQGEDFDRNFQFKAVQSMFAEHYERDFDMIFHFKNVQ